MHPVLTGWHVITSLTKAHSSGVMFRDRMHCQLLYIYIYIYALSATISVNIFVCVYIYILIYFILLFYILFIYYLSSESYIQYPGTSSLSRIDSPTIFALQSWNSVVKVMRVLSVVGIPQGRAGTAGPTLGLKQGSYECKSPRQEADFHMGASSLYFLNHVVVNV